MIKGSIRNIGDDWKEIGDVRKEHREEEYMKQFRKKKKNKK